ncbi:hypothetical protein BX666DRAFT_1900616, partial [Dichotomocladium elegans]
MAPSVSKFPFLIIDGGDSWLACFCDRTLRLSIFSPSRQRCYISRVHLFTCRFSNICYSNRPVIYRHYIYL